MSERSLADMTEEELAALTNEQAKALMLELISTYREALNKSVDYIANKLEEMASGETEPMDEDMIIGINVATNVGCFSQEVNAGALAVAQLELARIRVAERQS
jgi:hypothetical protein